MPCGHRLLGSISILADPLRFRLRICQACTSSNYRFPGLLLGIGQSPEMREISCFVLSRILDDGLRYVGSLCKATLRPASCYNHLSMVVNRNFASHIVAAKAINQRVNTAGVDPSWKLQRIWHNMHFHMWVECILATSVDVEASVVRLFAWVNTVQHTLQVHPPPVVLCLLSGPGVFCCNLVFTGHLGNQCASAGNKKLCLTPVGALGPEDKTIVLASLATDVHSLIHELVPFDTLRCRGSEMPTSVLAQPFLLALCQSL